MTLSNAAVGPLRIVVSADASARSVGADEVADELVSAAKGLGLEVEIIRVGSRGMCFLEPLVEIELPGSEQQAVQSQHARPQRVAFGNVEPGQVHAWLASVQRHAQAGTLAQVAQLPGCLGATEEIPYFARQTRLNFRRVGRADPLSWTQYLDDGGLLGLGRALGMDPQACVEEVVASGLRGRGGAAFPTGIKWRTAAAAPGRRKHIVCNADEGDSGTFSDRMLMEGDPFTLIEGMVIAGVAVGAEHGWIYLRSEYPDAWRVLSLAIASAREHGLLGDDVIGSGKRFELELRKGAGSYICGEETALLESLEGKRGVVRAKPPLPAIEGLFGEPTVVNNVITLGSVPVIFRDGAQSYAGYGAGRSRGTLPFQLAGNIRRGGLVELPFGVTLRELIEDFGGGTASGRPVRAVQVGGPLGPFIPADKLDLVLDYESFAAGGGMIGHGGIVVFDDTVDMAQMARYALEFCAIESCGKCTPCRVGAVRGVELVDRILASESSAREHGIEVLRDLCETMTHGSMCAMGGMTPFPVLSALDHFAQDFHPRDRDSSGAISRS